jgi:hypothetical protein
LQPDAILDVNLDRIKLDIVAKLALALNDGGKRAVYMTEKLCNFTT